MASYLLSGWKTISTFPITDKQMLSLGHMSLLDYNYPILEEKHLLLWDETNLFLEGTDYKENDRVNSRFARIFCFGSTIYPYRISKRTTSWTYMS
ncbi:hypothetical protein [Spiroplasma endosymbiont of Agriotes lineatus]|uniref:hypothetical protein n=1 Tax=Spiroplasma endosymbiont of Agriotes lineatus TaxID=3077930 RepID=UPI0030CB0AA6